MAALNMQHPQPQSVGDNFRRLVQYTGGERRPVSTEMDSSFSDRLAKIC